MGNFPLPLPCLISAAKGRSTVGWIYTLVIEAGNLKSVQNALWWCYCYSKTLRFFLVHLFSYFSSLKSPLPAPNASWQLLFIIATCFIRRHKVCCGDRNLSRLLQRWNLEKRQGKPSSKERTRNTWPIRKKALKKDLKHRNSVWKLLPECTVHEDDNHLPAMFNAMLSKGFFQLCGYAMLEC